MDKKTPASTDSNMRLSRRAFMATAGGAAIAACRPRPARAVSKTAAGARLLLFTSQGKTGVIDVDSGRARYLELEAPGQATWQPGPIFPDGRRIVLLSMEPRRDGPGKPFAQFYTQTPTHLWLYDVESGALDEICTRDRLAPFVTPALLLGEERMLVQVVRDGVGQIFNVALDGGDPREFTRAGEGLPYGLSQSPDGRRVAFHLASPAGYQIWTSDVDGGDRQLVAADGEHLYFGTSWSPDGQWILYADCHFQQDPGHDWADVCVGRAAGGEHRPLTDGQAMWFAATYGDTMTRGGGSNLPAWTPRGEILFPRRSPGAKVAWEYQPQREDVDHFNRDYKPESARGGVHVCRLDLRDGSTRALTAPADGVWDFRACGSPDGERIAFCRAATGQAPALFVMDADGGGVRQLARGIDGRGADHPRWLR